MMWPMNKELPSTAEFRARLQLLGPSALTELSSRSGVPFHTLLKIKTGVTENPGLETVRKFSPFLENPEKATA